jgi:hypothetical protein
MQDHLDRDVRAFYDYWKGKYLQQAGQCNSNGALRCGSVYRATVL